MSKKFSLGLSGSYSRFKDDATNNNIPIIYRRLNLGIRTTFLLEVLSTEKFHWYLGSRVGHSFWRITNDRVPVVFDDIIFKSPVSFQAYLGMNAFLSEKMALNFELGMPGPYFFQMGWHFKTK